MTTSVRVTAHNRPATVTVTNNYTVNGPSNISHTCTISEHTLKNGQSQDFVVTANQSVGVEELEGEDEE